MAEQGTENQILGTGIKFPPAADPATGRFRMVSGLESVKESVYLILMTQRPERFMRPEFGTDIAAWAFADTDASLQNLMAVRLAALIGRQEPRIEEVEVAMDEDDSEGCLYVTIGYTVRTSNTRENVVFPFYLEERPDRGKGRSV